MMSQSRARLESTVNGPAKSSHPAVDWRILTKTPCNVLIAGGPEAVERSLAALTPFFETPVCFWTVGVALPPTVDAATLVIRDVDDLSASRQRELSQWLEQPTVTQMRVVSTTSVPMFDLVTAGLFCDVLYYRLNTWLLDAECQPLDQQRVDLAAVARRAFRLYVERGCVDGHELDDWLQAERDLLETSTHP